MAQFRCIGGQWQNRRLKNGRRAISNSVQIKRGFTLIEVVAAAGLVILGIAVVLGAMSSMTKTEIKLKKSEYLNRLAVQKLDEVLAVGDVENAATDGDFADWGDENTSWTLEVAASSIENLTTVRVVVTDESTSGAGQVAEVSSVLFVPPEQGGTAQ